MERQMEHCVTYRRPRNPRWFARRFFLLLFGASIFVVIAPVVRAENTLVESAQLQLKPNRCVALHQGQVCYQTVQIFWNTQHSGNYCLYRQGDTAPVYCWQSAASGQHQYEFASDGSVQLQLINTQTKTLVATATLDVAWVYKANTRRKTHWRLF
jgi:hypothetical protein